MRIAFNFKNREEDIVADLIKRGYKVNNNGSGTIWVVDLSLISFSSKSINIEYKMQSYYLYLEDIEYFEIQKGN